MKEIKPLIFKNRNFFLVWIGQALSQAGTRMYQMAIIWWILTNQSGGGLEIGLFMVLGALPSVLLVKKIGLFIEKNHSKRVLLGAELIGFVIVLALILLIKASIINLAIVFTVGFLLALIQAFIDPTFNKAIPELVPPEDISSGVAFVTSTQSLANFLGAIIGAILIERLGIFGIAMLNALSYLLSFLFNSLAKFPYQRKLPAQSEDSSPQAIATPWEILNSMPYIKKMLLGFGFTNFFLTPLLVILPLYTKNLLKMSASTLAHFEAALWIGLLLGGFCAKFVKIFKDPLNLVAFVLLISSLSLISSGIIIDKYFYLNILFITGLGLGIVNVSVINFYQENVPPHFKGRFFAILQAMISFTFPIAYFFFGVITDIVSIPMVCIFQGAGILSLALYFKLLAGSPLDKIEVKA